MKQTTHQPLTDLQQHIRVVESSTMVLPREFDVCAWLGILPWDVIVLSVIGYGLHRWSQWMNEWILTISSHLIHHLTWQSLSINCVAKIT